MKILCLFVRFGIKKYTDALQVLDDWYQRHGLLAQRTLWIIDNAYETSTEVRHASSPGVIFAGDNGAWEFSAWARILRESAKLDEYEMIHFVTSAFNTLYTGYLSHFSPSMLGYLAAQGACLGHIDSYDQPIEIAGSSSQSWIRTCFFFLPAPLTGRIGSWATFTDPSLFFQSPNGTNFLKTAPLSADYQNHLRKWLEGQDMGGHKWHSPIYYPEKEAERFQRKTLAILNEHSLSITLRKLRIPLVDFCWLTTRCTTAGYAEIPPIGEMAQIAVRRRILGIAS